MPTLGYLPTMAAPRSDAATAADAVSLTLPAEPVAVARARRFVRQHGHTYDGDARDTAVLLTSELVTNAVVHGRSDVAITVQATPGRLLVEVADDNPRLPAPLEPHDESLNGRGLAIVCSMADACGTHPRGDGKVVWFLLDHTR